MRGRRVFGAAVGVMLAAAALGACGGRSGITSETPKQIISAAKSATESARSVTLSGDLQEGGPQTFFTLQTFRSGAADGTYGTPAGIGRIVIVDGRVYASGPVGFWVPFFKQAGLPMSPLEAAKLVPHWIILSTSTNGFSALTLPGFVHALSHLHGQVTKVRTRTVQGRTVVGVRSTSFGTLWIASSGTHYPVEVSQSTHQGSGTIIFSNWGKGSPPTAPVNSITIAKALRSK